MDTAKRALRTAACAGAAAVSAATLIYVFYGHFDLRPLGIKIYIAGLDKPLLWLAIFSAVILGSTPYPLIRKILAGAQDAAPPSPFRRAAMAAMLVAITLAAAALALEIIYGKTLLVTPLGKIRMDNATKTAGYLVVAVIGLFFTLGSAQRAKALDTAHRRRLHIMAALFTLAIAFAAGEAAVRIAAAKLPGVRYMVMAREENKGVVFPSLEAYLASKPDIQPFMPLLNYYDNSMGMRDTEFVTPKPAGRFRILALGDSFTYGMVPYPDSVMTLVEEKLKASCGGKDVEVLNFGVTGGGLWDYKTIAELAAARYQADLVVLHFYMGNDGPNLYYGTVELPGEEKRKLASGSYLVRFLGNLLTVARGVEMERLKKDWGARPERGDPKAQCGGCQITPGLAVTDDSPELASPYFVPARWIFYIAIIEVGVMYVQDEKEAEKLWLPAFETLDQAAAAARLSGARFAMALYPSSFQIYPQRVEEFLEGIKDVEIFKDDLHDPSDMERFKAIRREFIRPDHPNRMLAQYCQSRSMDCFDVTPSIKAAAMATDKPLYRLRETHWLIRGNHVAAQAEADYLKKLVCP